VPGLLFGVMTLAGLTADFITVGQNTARQSGGALGVALLGSLLGSGAVHGHSLNLHVPLLVATVGYLIAVALTWSVISGRKPTPSG
jgi:hypothetical protein